ncbi:hypothetical protein C8Q79DRAFT_969139, partial [Trametes meyenii]
IFKVLDLSLRLGDKREIVHSAACRRSCSALCLCNSFFVGGSRGECGCFELLDLVFSSL